MHAPLWLRLLLQQYSEPVQYNIQTKNWLDKSSGNGITEPATAPLANTWDLSHAHAAFVKMCDANPATGGVPDGWSERHPLWARLSANLNSEVDRIQFWFSRAI